MKAIMNPPYGGSLHLKTLESVRSAFYGVQIASLQPVIWLEDYGDFFNESSLRNTVYKDLADSISSLDVISQRDSQAYFSSRAPTDLGIYVLNGAGKADLRPLHLRGFSDDAASIVEKVLAKSGRFADHIIWSKPLERFSVVYSHMCGLCPGSHNFVYADGRAPDGTTYRENVKNQHKNDFPRTHFEFSTFEEADNFRKYLFTKTFKLVERATQAGTLRNFTTLPYMHSYKEEWTDEKLFSYFSFNEAEINLILNEKN